MIAAPRRTGRTKGGAASNGGEGDLAGCLHSFDLQPEVSGRSPEVHPEPRGKVIRRAVAELPRRVGDRIAVVQKFRRAVHLELFDVVFGTDAGLGDETAPQFAVGHAGKLHQIFDRPPALGGALYRRDVRVLSDVVALDFAVALRLRGRLRLDEAVLKDCESRVKHNASAGPPAARPSLRRIDRERGNDRKKERPYGEETR